MSVLSRFHANPTRHSVHRLQPRRIIPGQKVHASILYANTYKPQASLGEGFCIPIVYNELDVELDGGPWETGLFEETAAQELMASLGGSNGVEPMYLDALLSMLRTSKAFLPSNSLDNHGIFTYRGGKTMCQERAKLAEPVYESHPQPGPCPHRWASFRRRVLRSL